MTVWLEILVLAVVQGVAEFLPISSSGHVVVGAELFRQLGQPLEDKLTLNIMLHLGTLLAILVFYRRRIARLVSEDRRIVGLIAVGSIPAALVGSVGLTGFGPTFQAAMGSALLAGLMFPITAAMLLWAARRPQGKTTCRELGYGAALVIGALQAFAILPGISRSGATIAAALGCGMRREEAATFSFLLAIPVIAGAGLLKTLKLAEHGSGSTPIGGLVMGAAIACTVGWISLWWLVRWLQQGRLHRLAWYLFPLGVAVVVWQLVYSQ